VIWSGALQDWQSCKGYSCGRIALKSADPKAQPSTRFNELTDRRDVAEMVNGIRKMLEMASQLPGHLTKAGRRYAGSESERCRDRRLAEKVANTERHPTSTCRMGSDALSVVDSLRKVQELDGLRIVDGSILPPASRRPMATRPSSWWSRRSRTH
jgi:choline dehydrogenase